MSNVFQISSKSLKPTHRCSSQEVLCCYIYIYFDLFYQSVTFMKLLHTVILDVHICHYTSHVCQTTCNIPPKKKQQKTKKNNLTLYKLHVSEVLFLFTFTRNAQSRIFVSQNMMYKSRNSRKATCSCTWSKRTRKL